MRRIKPLQSACSAGASRGRRRAVLGALALTFLAAPAIASGCAASFDPPARVSTLRVLGITADKPYAAPGDEVTFEMTYFDGYGSEGGSGPRPVEITWLGGCFNPPNDLYFACYEDLGQVLQDIASGALPPEGVASQGIGINKFTLKLPDNLVEERPAPEFGPHYGIAYVFFAVCAGKVRPVLPDGTGRAPDFPLGCFDEAGNRLGSESFVPGYTQIYAFADGRVNQNPVIQGLTLNGKEIPGADDFDKIPTVKACPLTDEERRTPSCDRETDIADCASYTLEALVDPSVAEIDPDATGEDGGKLTETLWVSYFSDAGDISPGIKLVNEPVSGFNPDLGVTFIPPDEQGITTIWAVLRDARGGSHIVTRFIRVE
ncbi:MAG: hypothetical protein HUU21_16605 [Polyangiaceae bacterium]|nr:hypothetical protein [Polyangiaceae bacterium]